MAKTKRKKRRKTALIVIDKNKARIVNQIPSNMHDILYRGTGYMQTVSYMEADQYGIMRRRIKSVIKSKYNYLNRSFPAGMVDRCCDLLKNRGYHVKILDKRPRFEIKVEELAERIANFPIYLRPYQIDAISTGIYNPYMVFHMATGAGKCLDSSSLVLTNNGIIEIGKLVGNRTRQSHIQIHGKDHREYTSHLYYGGRKQTISLKTASGIEICGTPEHPLLTFDGNRFTWRKLSKIKTGDHICVCRGSNLWGKNLNIDVGEMPKFKKGITGTIPTKLTSDLCKLIGLIVGDGSVGKHMKDVAFFNDKRNVELRHWYTGKYEEYFGKRPTYKDKSNNGYMLLASSRKHAVFFRNILRIYDEDSNKVIPDCIMRSTKKMVTSFLSGLFEADGECYKSKIGYSSKSKKLIHQIQVIMINIGIVPRVRTKIINKRQYYIIEISGKDADLFMAEIGFITKFKMKNWSPPAIRNTNIDVIPNFAHEIKRSVTHSNKRKWRAQIEARRKTTYEKLLEFVNDGNTKSQLISKILSRNYFFDMVTDIKMGGVREVFDVCVPGSHSFVANGVVNHNTYVLQALAHITNLKTLILVNRNDLLEQHYKTLSQNMEVDIGIIRRNQLDLDHHICIATVQTIIARLKTQRYKMNKYLKSVQYVISDECFHEDTLIGSKKIKDIKVGDQIETPTGKRKVLRVYANKVPIEKVARVVMSDGTVIYCSYDHLFMDAESMQWVPVADMVGREVVKNEKNTISKMRALRKAIQMDEKRNPHTKILFKRVLYKLKIVARKFKQGLQGKKEIQKKDSIKILQNMREVNDKSSLLFTQMYISRQGAKPRIIKENDKAKLREKRTYTEENVRKQSNEKSTNTAKDDRDKTQKRNTIPMEGRKRRKRKTYDSADKISQSSRLGCRGVYSIGVSLTSWGKIAISSKTFISKCIQGRYRKCEIENSNRGRRQEAQMGKSKTIRQEKGDCLKKTRVESVEIYKQGNNERLFKGIVKDRNRTTGYVTFYDLEIEKDHCYFANGILVHNCHHSQSKTWRRIIKLCTNAMYRHGFSGTPWDHSSDNIELEAICGKIKYKITTSDLIRMGYLARPIITFHSYEGNEDPIESHSIPSMYEHAIVRNKTRNRAIVDVAMGEYEKGAKLLLVINRIAHGEILAHELRKRGIHDREIGYLHGKRGRVVRMSGKKEFERGNIRIMIVSQIWNEGIDIPSCDVLVKADSYGGGEIQDSEGVRNLIQQIGRVLRKPIPKGAQDVDIETEHIVRVHDFIDKQNKYVENWTKTRYKTCKLEPEWIVKTE